MWASASFWFLRWCLRCRERHHHFKTTQYLSHEPFATFLHSVRGSLSLLRNKQFLRRQGCKPSQVWALLSWFLRCRIRFSCNCRVRVPERLHTTGLVLITSLSEALAWPLISSAVYGPLAADQVCRSLYSSPGACLASSHTFVSRRCRNVFFCAATHRCECTTRLGLVLPYVGRPVSIETEGGTVVQFRNCPIEPGAIFGNAIQVVCYCSWYSPTAIFTAARPVTGATLTSRLLATYARQVLTCMLRTTISSRRSQPQRWIRFRP